MDKIEKLQEINENCIVFKDYDYESAIVGVSEDNRVIYSFKLMIEYLMNKEGMTDIDAEEWIMYNTVRANLYNTDPKRPIIMFEI